MIREVLTYPNRKLKEVSKKVELFDKHLHDLLDDMFDTMVARNGVGLAAIQIGVPRRVLIILVPDEEGNYPKENLLEVINPEVLEVGGSVKSNEGCLSVPEYYDDVDRFETVKLSYQDRHGNAQTIENSEFLAVALQHEMDHLDGRLFIDRLSLLKRKKFEKEFKKHQKAKKL